MGKRSLVTWLQPTLGVTLLGILLLGNMAKGQEATESESADEVAPPKRKPKKAGKKTKAKPASSENSTGESSQSADAEPPPSAASKSKTTTAAGKFKKIGVGLNAGYAYIGGGGGLEAWFSPTKSLDLSMRILGGSAKMAASGEASLLETAEVTMVQVGANARYFLGKSLYLLGGLGYNTFSGSYGVTINTTKQEYLLPMKASALSLNVAFGNLWKWDSGFALGFEWVGYSSFMGMDVKLDDPQTAEEQLVFDAFRVAKGGGDPEKKAKELLARNNIYALMMTVGYGF